METRKHLPVLKLLLHESINGEGLDKPDLTKSEMVALDWCIEQAEKVERYEKTLKDIMINCDNPSFRSVAKMALERKF